MRKQTTPTAHGGRYGVVTLKHSSSMMRLKPQSLLELDGGASLFELLLGLLGVFLLGLLENRLRSFVHELLGVSQAEVGDGLDSLDDLDLLVASGGQDDVELGLLFLSGIASGRSGSDDSGGRSGSLDVELILEGLSDVAAQGITEIHTDDFMSGYASDSDFHPYFQAYCELADEGKLPVRVYQQCSLWSKKDLEGFLAEGHRTGEEHGLYRLGPLKLIVDGSLGAHTAKLKQPYKNDPSANGCLNHSGEELYILCKLAQEKGMQIAAHCI